jgi:hypothetical protein
MKTNMGNADRLLRIVVAATIAVLFFTGAITGTVGYILLVAGGIFLLTSLAGYCPLYSLLGINTCRVKKQGQ